MFDLGADGNARLFCEDTGESVVFDYNPAAIVISHSAPMQTSAANGKRNSTTPSAPAPSVNAKDLPSAMGMTTISIRALTFAGPDLVANCTLLHDWSQFKDSVDNSPQKMNLPNLKFSWGDLRYPVNLNRVTINYTRFSRTGAPVRAVVDLTLHLIPKFLRPTNPSSGGLDGRSTHMLTGAETLPGLATRTYGGPEHWREIAAANGIQDPLRVRPGTVVYLPSVEEGGR